MPGLGTFSFARCGQFEGSGQMKERCSCWRAQSLYSVTLSAIVSFHDAQTVRAKSRHVKEEEVRILITTQPFYSLSTLLKFVNFRYTYMCHRQATD